MKSEKKILGLKLTAIGGATWVLSWSSIAAKDNLEGQSMIKVAKVQPKSQKKPLFKYYKIRESEVAS